MTNELKAKFAEYDKEYALTCAQDFIKYTNQDIKDITRRFFIIGFRLNEAKEQGYVETLGYPDIETLAEEEFGFKRSTTYGLISVFRRFAKLSDNCTYLNQIEDPYKDYTYSQLLEINKLVYLPSGDYIKTVIPPSSSVRDVAAYIKFRKKKAGNEDYTLPQWKDLQKNTAAPVIEPAPAPTMANAQLEGQLSLEDVTEESAIETPTATDNVPKAESEEETPEVTAPVQTFGLPTCADKKEIRKEYANENWKPIQDINTIISQEELTELIKKTCKTFDTKLYYPTDNGFHLKVSPEIHAADIYFYLKEFLQCKNLLIARDKMTHLDPEEKLMRESHAYKPYNFFTRDGVREFLQDYKQWDYLHYDPFLRATYRYKFKNGMYLFACETQVFCGKDKPQNETEIQITYFLNAQNMKSCAQISKRQLEQFCTEHKDEL